MFIVDTSKFNKMQAEVSCIYIVNVKHKNVLLQINLNLRRSQLYVELLCIEP